MLEPGARIGRYLVEHPLGAGGMGVVYRATLLGPAGFRKPVALKVLHGEGDGLVAEARLGGLLKHPNLVEVYALEEVDGRWVCAMELVSGGSLRRHLPLSPAALVEVARQVCGALSHAWSAVGLVHLDLKPENLLLDGATVKIADLGIASFHGHRARGVRGTPAYMAPEQRRGGPVDPRTDLWALGVVMVELATCRPAADPGQVPWLRPVLERCLDPAPSRRFGSMAELAAALDRLDVWGPSLAQQLGIGEPTLPTPRTASAASTITFFERAPTNLVHLPDRFVGRDREVADVIEALDRPGVVTLKGIGGLGKTRLAREAALEWHADGGGEAWFVDLVPATDAIDVLGAIARVLGVQLGGASVEGAIEQVAWAIAGRGRCLILLDNFEQILACAHLVDTWRSRAPDARFLVTSRSPLALADERVVDVEPLSVAAAVELLVARGQARGRDVEGDPALPALAARLDGLPLALELAAARFALMTPGQVLDRLDRRLRLLAQQQGTRHGTLAAALDWSWDLLDADEREAFAQCSVFVGSFTVEDADAVLDLSSGSFSLDVLQSLIDHSLVRDLRDGRLALYESARAYARSKLDDATAVDARHGAWLARLGDWDSAAVAADLGPAGRRVRARLAHAHENIVAAVERAVDRGDGQTAARALTAACLDLYRRGPMQRALDLGQRVFALPLDDDARGRVAWEVAWSALLCGRTEDSVEHARLATEAFEACDHPRLAVAVLTEGLLRLETGDLEGAETLVERASSLAEQRADRRTAGRARALRASLLGAQGRLADREAELERALQDHREARDGRQLLVTLVNLAGLHADRGRPDEARACCAEAMELIEDFGDRRFGAMLASRLGHLTSDAGDLTESRRYHETALTESRAIGNRRSACYALCHLAQLDLQQGWPDLARERMERAVAQASELGSEPLRGLFLTELGRIGLLAGDPPELAHARLVEGCALIEGWSAPDHALATVVRLDAQGIVEPADLAELDQALTVLASRGGGRDYVKALAHGARVRARAGHDPAETLASARKIAAASRLAGPFLPPLDG